MAVVILKALKQARAAFALLSPVEIRERAHRPVRFGLVANSHAGYEAMEDFLIPPDLDPTLREVRSEQVFRAGDPDAAGEVDLVLYEPGIAGPHGAYSFHPEDEALTVASILHGNADIHLPLARQFPAFRAQVIDRIIHAIARENALFAVATALPDIVPSLVELPWALGEWASDTAFLTANQVRMALLIAAACGKPASFQDQKGEILMIGAGAFGWRALARELVGKIPLGGGLIPKGAIAYAGTYLVGKGLDRYHRANGRLTGAEKRGVYQAALERGARVVRNFSEPDANPM